MEWKCICYNCSKVDVFFYYYLWASIPTYTNLDLTYLNGQSIWSSSLECQENSNKMLCIYYKSTLMKKKSWLYMAGFSLNNKHSEESINVIVKLAQKMKSSFASTWLQWQAAACLFILSVLNFSLFFSSTS